MFADPHVRHRGMVTELVDRRGEPRRTLGSPIKLSGTPATLRTPPAEFGAHTDEVLAAVGYGAADLAALRARGVI